MHLIRVRTFFSISHSCAACHVLPHSSTASTAITSYRRFWLTAPRSQNDNQQPEQQQQQQQQPVQVVEDPRNDKIKDMEKKVKDLNEMWKVTLNEVEKVKQRMNKDVIKAQDFGVEKLVRNLFSVMDTLNICLQNKPNFNLPEYRNNMAARSAFESIETTKTQFCAVFKDSYDIEEVVPTLGDSFDPMQHHALFEVDAPPGSSLEPGKIGIVVKSGWKRKDTLLRPASVGTVKLAPE